MNRHGLWFLALAFLYLSGTAAVSQEKPAEFAWQKARGTIVDRVACLDDPTQSYALYLPSQYSPDRRWPVIYAFDPAGRGNTAVEVYQSAAEKYGYIVAGSINSKNGPVAIQTEAAQALWRDTHRRFSIDKNRIYTTGLSGGAREATYLALYCSTCAIAGVIAYGAGYPLMDGRVPPGNDRFAYYAAMGDEDFNFPEIMTLRRKKDEQGASFKIKIYPGTHQWAPPAIAEDAIEWMEVKAMQSGVEKIDPAFVSRIFERTQAEAAQSEREGNTLGRYYALRSLALDFKGLEDVTQFQEKLAPLKASKAWKNANRDEQREIESQESLTTTAGNELSQLGSAGQGAQPGLAKHIASVMENLRHQEQAKGTDSVVASRAFTQLLIEGIEAGQDQFRRGRYTEAASYFALMAEVAPDKPGPLVLLAEAKVRTGNRKEALKALEQAVERGLKNAKTLTDDPELQPLASDPAFQRIVQGLA
jgi:dienelactone hydrolase